MAYIRHYDGFVSAILKNLIVYSSDIDDYDVLIGMNLIAQSDFFLTCIDGKNRFAFDIPATGKAE